jgi:hypothetical protein
MPVIVVEPLRWSRSPLQTFFLVLIAVTGLLTIFNQSDNQVIIEMGEPWASLWGFGLIMGSAVTLTGSFWRDKVTGMLIERSGVLLLGGISAIWPILIVKVIGWDRSPFTVVSVAIFSATCLLQFRYINKHIKLIIEAVGESRQQNE